MYLVFKIKESDDQLNWILQKTLSLLLPGHCDYLQRREVWYKVNVHVYFSPFYTTRYTCRFLSYWSSKWIDWAIDQRTNTSYIDILWGRAKQFKIKSIIKSGGQNLSTWLLRRWLVETSRLNRLFFRGDKDNSYDSSETWSCNCNWLVTRALSSIT